MPSQFATLLAQLQAGKSLKNQKIKIEMDDCVLFCIAQKKWPKSIQLSYEDLSKINEAHRFRLDKVELKNPNKNIALVYLSISLQ